MTTERVTVEVKEDAPKVSLGVTIKTLFKGSPIELNKYTKPIYEEEIPINNCNLLFILLKQNCCYC